MRRMAPRRRPPGPRGSTCPKRSPSAPPTRDGCTSASTTLPREYREVLVLRELEELSYKEISAIVDVPIGTVMSRLARGRDLLQQRVRDARARRTS